MVLDPHSRSGTGPLHSMNPPRVSFIRENDARLRGRADLPPLIQLKDLEVLDVGCGGGILAESLARLGARVTAIDPSEENIRVAESHKAMDSPTSSIAYKNCTIEEMASSGQKFDIVCCLEVLEHVNSVSDFISNCSLCVKEEGSLFFSTINRTLKSYGLAILGAEYFTRLVPRGTHDWRKFITVDELHSHLNRCGFSISKTNGIVLDDFPPALGVKLLCNSASLNWRLTESDYDVNYIVHASRLPPNQ